MQHKAPTEQSGEKKSQLSRQSRARKAVATRLHLHSMSHLHEKQSDFLSQSVKFYQKEIFARIHKSFDTSRAFQKMLEATGGDFYIFGGTVRRAILNEDAGGDLDIIVKNNDTRIFEAFNKIGLCYTLNSKGHHRYQWNKLQIDICQPQEFFRGFDDVPEMLSFVDFKLNSVAFHVKSKSFIDPFNILQIRHRTDLGINWKLWESTDALNLTVLLIRLAKLLFDLKDLKLNAADSEKIIKYILPRLATFDWENVKLRFPEGKDVFVEVLTKLITRNHPQAANSLRG